MFLILELLQNDYDDFGAIFYVKNILTSISHGFLTILLASSLLQLVCAQAPYNMRGLFGGCMVLVLMSPLFISVNLFLYHLTSH